MHCLWCGDVTFNKRGVIDEAPHFTLPNDYRSLFPLLRLTLSHTHTVAHTSVWSTPLTALEKENHSHLGSFHYPHHLILTVISAQRRGDNHREAEAEASALSVLRVRHTHIHNDRLWQLCRLARQCQATSIGLACLTLTQLEPVMNETSPHIWYNLFSFPGQTIQMTAKDEYGWVMEHRQRNSHGH